MSRSATPSAKAPSPARSADSYLKLSESPLSSLLFVLPLAAFYELGTRTFVRDRIVAFTMMQQFFEMCGATARLLPPLALVGMLLGGHIARRDPWRWRPMVLGAMAAESFFWGIPLIVIGLAVRRYLPLQTADPSLPGWVALSFGAGVYEELVFRLIPFALLGLLLSDVLKLRKGTAGVITVISCAVVFSLYHYWDPTNLSWEVFRARFAWDTFLFRTIAGVYFGSLMLLRGFGITVGAHAIYDILILVPVRFL